jgi:hypothetical protein
MIRQCVAEGAALPRETGRYDPEAKRGSALCLPNESAYRTAGLSRDQHYSKVQVDPFAEPARSDPPHDTVSRRMSALSQQTKDDGSTPH